MEDHNISFKHSTEVQVRFNDIDMMGHVNNAVYQNYYDFAKVSYFNCVLGKSVDWKQNGLVLAKITIEYLNPVFLEEALQVRSKIIRLGNKSLDIYQEIYNPESMEIKSSGTSVMVGFDFHSQETIEIPGAWKQKIQGFEAIS